MSDEHRVIYEEYPQYGMPRATCVCGDWLTATNVGSPELPTYSIAAALAKHIRVKAAPKEADR